MLPKLGRAVLRSGSATLKPLTQTTLTKRMVPLVPITIARSIATTTPTSSLPVHMENTVPTSVMTESSVLETLEECKNIGNLKGAIKAVQHAREQGVATASVYLCLVDLVREAPFDIQASATVANWFYTESTLLPLDVVENMDIWKSVLKLGFKLGSTYRTEDLRALVDRFTEIFDLTTLDDPTAWELLLRAYGIMGREDAITACINKNESNQPASSFYVSALLSYASTHSNENVEKMLEKLQSENALTPRTLLKLIRCYGFMGDIPLTSKYMDMCRTLFPKTKVDKTMLLIAHKVALEDKLKELEVVRGSHGLGLKPDVYPELDELHSSWFQLTQDMFTGEHVVDIIDCNVVLEYLTAANRIDPVQFPMSMAEEIFDNYMPAHDIKPNEASYRNMLVGYSTSREYNSKRNVRLDKALEVVTKMQVAGVDTLNHPTFHSLFRACIPHQNGNYQYDNFRLNSLLPARPISQYHPFKVDGRLFELEKIMLESQLPHDRFTFTTLLTCLAVAGKNQAFRSRWRSLKAYGLRRDIGLYRAAFALSSLESTQAKRAMTVIRNELKREIPQHGVNWETYLAMLDCCITAQLPQDALSVMQEMRQAVAFVHQKDAHADSLSKWPYLDSAQFFAPMLRASIAIKGLNTTADKISSELDSKNVVYDHSIWETKLSQMALNNDTEGIRQLFNKYTMSRFENQGKIPVPVREKSSPVVPFPTAPYNKLDMEFIDVYLASLLDNQNLSLVFDVLRTLNDQTDTIGISRRVVQGVVRLAKKEQSTEDLKWLSDNILPKLASQNNTIKQIKKHIEFAT